MDLVHDRGSMDPVHESGPWTRSKEGVHGPLVHVLSSPSGIGLQSTFYLFSIRKERRVLAPSAVLIWGPVRPKERNKTSLFLSARFTFYCCCHVAFIGVALNRWKCFFEWVQNAKHLILACYYRHQIVQTFLFEINLPSCKLYAM